MSYYTTSYNYTPQRKQNLLSALFCRPDPTPSPSQAYYTPAPGYNYNVYSSQGYAPPTYTGPHAAGAYSGGSGGKTKYSPAVYYGNPGSGGYYAHGGAQGMAGKNVSWGGASVRRY